MDLTILEVNLTEPSFRANAPFSGGRGDDESDDGTGIDVSAGEAEGSGRSPLPFLVGLVFLVGIGLAVRRLLGDDSEVEAEETERIAA